MAAPVSAELLAGAKLWCNITWSDEATDAKVSALIASGEAYIDGKLGAAAHSAEPMLNTAMPAKSKRRRPRLSLKRPTLTLSAVRVSR